jgi:hypothetical protein
MVGYSADAWPVKEAVDVWKNLLPEATWFVASHFPHLKVHDAPVGVNVLKYAQTRKISADPAEKRIYGWKCERLELAFTCGVGTSDLGCTRLAPENSLQKGDRGVGRDGADFWGVPQPVLDRYRYEWTSKMKYQAGRFGLFVNLDLTSNYLAPGPKGTVSTVRFEMMREGVQECEARIFIEKALTDKNLRAKLGEERAERCQAMLDERSRYSRWMHLAWATDLGQILSAPTGYTWFAGSGWQERSKKLYETAADVTMALGGK